MQYFLSFVLIIITSNLSAAPMEWEPQAMGQWNSANHPGIFFSDFEADLNKILTSNVLEKELWSDDYWPRMMGGIAYRWQTYQRANDYDLYSRREVRRLSPIEIDELSPAEKFDLLDGDTEFSFTKKIKRQNPASAPGWHGICHGWAEANLHIDPPKEIILKNRSGVEIPFRRSDVAALISYYYGKERRGRVTFLGRRCKGSSLEDTRCQDVNPGAFHITLAESMKRSRGLIADFDPGAPVWNHPIKSYQYELMQTREPHENAADGTVKEVLVLNKVNVLVETSPSTEANGEVLDELYFEYWLELDSNDQIIGGSWYKRPMIDFLWYRGKKKLPSRFQRLISDS